MFKSSFIVMIINMLSRILGLIREMIIGSVFGATGMTDAYVSATKIPNFFTTLFGEGSLGTVFIPIYNRGIEEEGKERTDDFVFSLLNLIVAFTSTLSVIMIFFSKQILKVTTGFNDPKRFDAANNLLKIVAFYFLFIALSGVVSSLLNNYKKFAVSASMGIVFNLTIIIGTLLLKNRMGIYGLGVAYLFSGVFQLVIMLPQFFQIMKKYKFILNLKDEYVKEMFVLMVPTLVGIFGYQINEIVDNRFATSLPAGTASALNYASRLYLLPIGVFAISLAVVIFPTLSKAVVKNDSRTVKRVVHQGLYMLSFLIVPSSVILFGKIISTKKASTADDGVTMIPSSAKIKYSVCKIDGLNYRNIMVIVRSWEENLNLSNVNTKYLPLDGHDISIDYDTRVIYVKGEIL